MKNKSLLIFISSVIIIFVGIFTSDQLGYWSTQSSGDFLSKDEEGNIMAIPDELRGSTTFEEIENAFGIPANRLAAAYNFDSDEPGLIKVMYVSDAFAYLGEDVEMGTGSVRLFIYIYNGLDTSDLEEIENIPSTAVEVLKEDGKWTNESELLMANYIIDIDKEPLKNETISDLMEEDHEKESDDAAVGTLEINGKTTINDMINAGLTLEAIETEMDVEIGNINLSFKDICEQNGLDFSSMKSNILLLLEEN